jgi:hypothetical protein
VPDLAGGHPRPAAFYCPVCRSPFTAAAAGSTSRALSGPVTTAPGGGWCCGLWHGLRATAEDGTHFDLLRGPGKHTSQNSVFFGSPKGSGPSAHMVSLTGIWSRTEMALAAGGNSTSEKHLADQLLPALGPGMVFWGRGFPSHEGLLAIRDTGARFVMRTSASWGLRRCGKPLAAALYGDRWSIELVFCELKVTVMAAGSTCRSPRPAGVYQELLAAITIQTSLRLLGAHYATQAGVPPCRISFTALRDTVIKNMNLGHGTTAGLLAGALHRLHTDITRHPARWTVPHRPGRHFPRYTIKKVRSANQATSSQTPPAPTCSPAHLSPAHQQTTPANTPAIPARQQPRPPPRRRHDQADQPQHHPAPTGPATSAPPAATMPAPRKTTHRRPPRHPPGRRPAPDNPASQSPRPVRPAAQQPSTTDSYEILASTPKITLATLPSTERQCTRQDLVPTVRKEERRGQVRA